MSTVHDYAGCQVEVCVQCDSYAEIRSVPASGHSQACQCRPCSAVRDSIRAVVGLDQGGLRPKWAKMLDKSRRQHQQAQRPAEAQHLRDCAGPGCGATCTCWCHAQEERAFETENRRPGGFVSKNPSASIFNGLYQNPTWIHSLRKVIQI